MTKYAATAAGRQAIIMTATEILNQADFRFSFGGCTKAYTNAPIKVNKTNMNQTTLAMVDNFLLLYISASIQIQNSPSAAPKKEPATTPSDPQSGPVTGPEVNQVSSASMFMFLLCLSNYSNSIICAMDDCKIIIRQKTYQYHKPRTRIHYHTLIQHTLLNMLLR